MSVFIVRLWFCFDQGWTKFGSARIWWLDVVGWVTFARISTAPCMHLRQHVFIGRGKEELSSL